MYVCVRVCVCACACLGADECADVHVSEHKLRAVCKVACGACIYECLCVYGGLGLAAVVTVEGGRPAVTVALALTLALLLLLLLLLVG